MPSSREIKPSSEEKRLNSVEKPKSPDTWRCICKQADQANRDTSSASSSSRDTGKRPLSDWEVKQLEEMPIGEDGKRAEKLVIPEGPLPGGMWKKLFGKSDKEASTSSGSNLERDHARISDCLEKGQYTEAIELCEHYIDKCVINFYSLYSIKKILKDVINACLDNSRDREAVDLCYASFKRFERAFGFSYEIQDIIKDTIEVFLKKGRNIYAKDLSECYIGKYIEEARKDDISDDIKVEYFMKDVSEVFLDKGRNNEAIELHRVFFEKYDQKFGSYKAIDRINSEIRFFLKKGRNIYAKELSKYYIDKYVKEPSKYTCDISDLIEMRFFMKNVLEEFLDKGRGKEAIELCHVTFERSEQKFGLYSYQNRNRIKCAIEAFLEKDRSIYAKELFYHYIDKCQRETGKDVEFYNEVRYFIGSALKVFLDNRRGEEAMELIDHSFDKYEKKFGLGSTEVKMLTQEVLSAFWDKVRDKKAKKLLNRAYDAFDKNRDRKEVIGFLNRLVVECKRYNYRSPSPPRERDPILERAEALYRSLPYYRQQDIHPSIYSPERRIREDPSFRRQIEEQFLDMMNCDDE